MSHHLAANIGVPIGPVQKYIGVMVKRMGEEPFQELHTALHLLIYILCKMEFVAIDLLCQQGEILSNCHIVVMEAPPCNADIQMYVCSQFRRFANFRRVNKCTRGLNVNSFLQMSLIEPKDLVVLWVDLDHSKSTAFIGHHSIVNLQCVALIYFDVKERIQSFVLPFENSSEGVSCNIFQGSMKVLELLELGPKELNAFNPRKDALSIPIVCCCKLGCKCFSGDFIPPCYDLTDEQKICLMVKSTIFHWRETNLRLEDPCLKKEYGFELTEFLRSLEHCKYRIRVNLYRFSALPKCLQTSRNVHTYFVIKKVEYDRMEFVCQIKVDPKVLLEVFQKSQLHSSFDLPLYFRSLTEGSELETLKSEWKILRMITEARVFDRVKFMISIIFDKPFTRSAAGWTFSNILFDDRTISVHLENLECTVVGARPFRGAKNYVCELSLVAPDATIKSEVVVAIAEVLNQIPPMFRINSDAICDGAKVILNVSPGVCHANVCLFKEIREKLGLKSDSDLERLSEEDRDRIHDVLEEEKEKAKKDLCEQYAAHFKGGSVENFSRALDEFGQKIQSHAKSTTLENLVSYENSLFSTMNHEEKLSKVLDGPLFESEFREVQVKQKGKRVQPLCFEQISGKPVNFINFIFQLLSVVTVGRMTVFEPSTMEERVKMYALGNRCIVCRSPLALKKHYCKECKSFGRKFVYCGLSCQRLDWKDHRLECMSWALKATNGDLELATAMVATPSLPQT